MPDSALPAGLTVPSALPPRPRQRRWVSPLMRRILLVNAMPLALLVATLLYLDQYQNGLLEAEVGALREQARIYAGALGESAVRQTDPNHPVLVPDLARPLLRRLTDPTPNAQAKLYSPDGQEIADSRLRPGAGGAVTAEPMPPAADRSALLGVVARSYDWLLALMPHHEGVLAASPNAGVDWQPDVRQELRLTSSNDSHEMPPYIRRTTDHRLLVTVAEPVERNHHTVGIVLLTRDAREVDTSLLDVRLSILGLFVLALALTVLLSWYLSMTIARPILHLAQAAHDMREGSGREGSVPAGVLRRGDEIAELGAALADSAAALWGRMDAIERFAADVAHEIKNPLSSIRSAIETLRRGDEDARPGSGVGRATPPVGGSAATVFGEHAASPVGDPAASPSGRIEDPARRRKLLAIIADDVVRLDRLISDISDASRVDAELSRTPTERVPVAPMLTALAEIAEATRGDTEPHITLRLGAGELAVQAVEGRLVQVLRNLMGNARSFSPPGGTIRIHARQTGSMVEIAVDDEGPGIPEAKLEHIFDRFYSERPASEQFGKHSGLGLSISRQIVEALHGRISAENRRDAAGRLLGARFVVRLPGAD